MNKEKEFWDLIGVKPNQYFRLNNSHRITKDIFYFDFKTNLRVRGTGEISRLYNLYDILSGSEKIVIEKVIELTKDDHVVLKYLKLCGYQWVTKDKNGEIYAFTHKPCKLNNGVWNTPVSTLEMRTLNIEVDLNFLSWEDEEPWQIS